MSLCKTLGTEDDHFLLYRISQIAEGQEHFSPLPAELGFIFFFFFKKTAVNLTKPSDQDPHCFKL